MEKKLQLDTRQSFIDAPGPDKSNSAAAPATAVSSGWEEGLKDLYANILKALNCGGDRR